MTKLIDKNLLDAAARLIRRKSFAAVTTREIAADAGVHLGSLSYRYKSKNEILFALSMRGLDKMIADVKAAIDRAQDPSTALQGAIKAHIINLLNGEAPIFVLLYEWRAIRGDQRRRLNRKRDAYRAIWDGILHRGMGAGLVDPHIDIDFLRLALFGVLNRCAQDMSEYKTWSVDQIVEQTWDLFFGRPAARPDCARRPTKAKRMRRSLT